MRKTLFTEISSEELIVLIQNAVKAAVLETIPINNSPPNDMRQLLSSKEACAFLKISQPTLIKLRKEGKIKARNIGGKLFYSKTEISKTFKI